ncbi:MAG: AAA family ATPase [Microgenomates group bacterium]
MSSLSDRVSVLRRTLTDMQVPPELVSRINGYFEEIERIQTDIAAQVHIEQLLDYIDWIVNLPWNKRSIDAIDIVKAQEMLNRNHYGMQSVKDKIIEYLAVLKLQQEKGIEENELKVGDAGLVHGMLARRAPILCLIGLVGTGKTTLAKSVAEAMGRKFIRIPFGGLSDSLDLRGQSRVRPDAEIGLILKGLRYAGTKNPVMLLDEVDRVAEHARGDIMGVLVELLDPEQNKAFTDHYLDVPFDLSDVLFIATANNTTNISTAVLDRLEVIQMPSYSDEEKITIARDYVMPELLKASGLTKENLTIDDAVWPKLVRPLGYDAGIRSIERTMNGVCRKVARAIVEGKGKTFHITESNIKEYIETY